MERLTFDGNFCDISQCRDLLCPHYRSCAQKQMWERLKAYEDSGLSPQACAEAQEIEETLSSCDCSISRMVELMKADKDGRVVVLPCKVGDMVWVIAHPWTDKLQKKPLAAYVNGMKLFPHGLYVNVLFDTIKINGTRDYGISRIGKTVFLTREEAGKTMKGETEK